MDDLIKINLYLKLARRIIIDIMLEEVIEHGCCIQESKGINRVTQKLVNLFDDDILKVGIEMIRSKTEYFSDLWQTTVINLFVEQKDIWVRPKAAQATKYTARYEVEGPPVRTRIRPIPKELKAKLNKQLDDMFKNGIITFLKSAWCSV